MPVQNTPPNPLAAVALLAILAFPATLRAEGGHIRVRADVEYFYSDIETEDKDTGDETQTDFYRWRQKYDVEVQRDIYEFLGFRLGGVFELIDTTTKTSDAPDTGSEETTAWFYSELNLNNPLYDAGAAYRRREFEFDPDDFDSTKIHREEFAGLFHWRPVGLPSVDVDFNRFLLWDDADTRDSVVDRFVLKSRYEYRDFDYDYTYTRNDEERRILDNQELFQSHNGGLGYSRRFFDDQLQVSASARLTYDTLEPSRGGQIERPTVPPGDAFFLLDDDDPGTLTEVDGANPLTNVNIGRNAPMDPVGVGLDFGPPTDVDTVHLLPQLDPQNPLLATAGEIAAVADLFVWTAFTSDDQENWDEIPVTRARYDVFENRFEISFSAGDATPYIKVVTTPVVSAAGEIRIAQIRGFTTVAVSQGTEIEDFDQTYNLGFQWIISDRTTTSYESYFRMSESQPFDITRTTLNNSVSLRHAFTPKLFLNTRVLRTDTSETDRKDGASHSYTASLRADHLDTLHQTLVYSGRHDDGEAGTSISNSIFLRTDADLYRGWSANLDLGYSMQDSQLSGDSDTTSLRIGTQIDPNPKLNFAVNYRVSWTNRSDGGSGIDQNARFQGFWVPLRTLSFFASVQLRDQQSQGEGLKIFQDYSANWAPFPDGLLDFSLAYNQSVDTEDRETRILSPQINWRITRTTLLNLRFNIGTLESEDETRDVKNVRATLRTYY
jgi:hypothetical protein